MNTEYAKAGDIDHVIRFIQFGDGPALRALADERIDAYNLAHDGNIGGVAVMNVSNPEQQALYEHAGWYILHSTGIGEKGADADERVIKCLNRVILGGDADELRRLAALPSLEWIMTDGSDELPVASAGDDARAPRSLAGRVAAFLYARYCEKKSGLAVLSCEPIERNADRLLGAIAGLALEWGLDAGFFSWLRRECRFFNTRSARQARIVPYAESEEEAKAPKHYALLTEGRCKWCFEEERLPESMKFIENMPGIVCGKARGALFDAEQRIFEIALMFSAVLAGEVNEKSVSSLMRDAELRGMLASLMTEEVLPSLDIAGNEGLNILLTAFERLENAYFDIPAGFYRVGCLETWRRMVLPILKADRGADAGHKKIHAWTAMTMMAAISDKTNEYQRLHALSSDMEPEMLSYALLADEEMWGEDLRLLPGLPEGIARAVQDLQLLGIRGTLGA